MRRQLRFLLALAAVCLAQGCMLSPLDELQIEDHLGEILFSGLSPYPSTEVCVEVLDPAYGEMVRRGCVQTGDAVIPLPQGDFYDWQLSATIAESEFLDEYRWFMGAQGWTTRVRSHHPDLGIAMTSLGSGFLDCASEFADPLDFYENCASDSTPYADLTTPDFAPFVPSEADHLSVNPRDCTPIHFFRLGLVDGISIGNWPVSAVVTNHVGQKQDVQLRYSGDGISCTLESDRGFDFEQFAADQRFFVSIHLLSGPQDIALGLALKYGS